MPRVPLFIAALLALAGTGCVALPHAEPGDAERARARFPGADVASLERGRALYVKDCSGCHTLYLPQSRKASDWPAIVAEMAEEAGLDDADLDPIVEYLVTMSERPPGAAGKGQ